MAECYVGRLGDTVKFGKFSVQTNVETPEIVLGDTPRLLVIFCTQFQSYYSAGTGTHPWAFFCDATVGKKTVVRWAPGNYIGPSLSITFTATGFNISTTSESSFAGDYWYLALL